MPTTAPTPKPTPWAIQGAEFPVNQATTGDQHAPSIAATGQSLDFILVWTDDQRDGDGLGVVGRRYDKLGAPLSDEFPVNTFTTGDQSDPEIAADYYGNFVVVWSSTHAGTAQIFARRFDTTGAPAGTEFQVNTYTTGNQTEPDVAMNTESFVVVWSSAPVGAVAGHDGSGSGIFAQRFASDGTPDGTEFQVNTYTTGEQVSSAVGMTYGPFVVMWQSDGQDGSLGGIFGQVFGNAGPEGEEFPVNTSTAGDQITPDVAMSNTGMFATWATEGVDGSDLGISGRLFAFGPMGPEFQVNTYTTGAQRHPRVAATIPWQDFVVVWESEGQDDPGEPATGVFAQRFQNKPLVTSAFSLPYLPRWGSEYQINNFTTGGQRAPAVVLDNAGQFVVAWASDGQDGDGTAVVARRFGSPEPLRARVDERPSGGTSNVNGILEPGERVVLDPSWSVRSQSLPLSGTAANLTGPVGPTYTIEDASAEYGTVSFAGNDCFRATGNCYEVSVGGVRPAPHWDATIDETLSSSSGPLGVAANRTKTWALHVGQSFDDVPLDVFYPFVENVFHNRVSVGCGAASFCGEDPVLRQQMAVLVLKSQYGADFVPPAATGNVFDDVPASSPYAAWIEELAREGVVAGCVAPPPPALPSYCPTAAVNRQQTAVFLVKTKYPSDPTGCNGIFEDVPCSSPFAPYVEFLLGAGVTAGCQFDPVPLYCPTDPTKRKQMATFLVKTFGLELYGPD